jgi:CO/xanthine dehydrogenase Mo-binding subunit
MDYSTTEAISKYEFAYGAPHVDIGWVRHETGVPTGWYRAVSYIPNVFAVESFMDEAAHAGRRDPVEFRLAHMKDPRHKAVLMEAAKRAGWGKALPAGTALGVATNQASISRRWAGKGKLELRAWRLVLRVCTYFYNIVLFCKYLIASRPQPRLQVLKRKRAFADKRSLEVSIMKLVQSLIVVAALAIPAASSFAQSNEAVAPTNVQAAQTSVNPGSGAATDFGGVADGTSVSGSHHQLRSFGTAVAHLGHKIQGSIRPDPNDGMKPVFFGGA